jgi:sulfate permease, SulP family
MCFAQTLQPGRLVGVVLGVQSVPDGLATGLLAGVNPLAGLYGCMVGTLGGALTTSSGSSPTSPATQPTVRAT